MSDRIPDSTQIEKLRDRFLAKTGLSRVEIAEETAGPETFLRVLVGRDAPLYRRVLGEIDRELDAEHPYRGRLSLEVRRSPETLTSPEVELLRSLITRSLRSR